MAGLRPLTPGCRELSSLSRESRRSPVVGKQFGQSGDGVHRDAREHVIEPGKRLDTAPLTCSDEASQDGGRPPAAIPVPTGGSCSGTLRPLTLDE
jgi:hypothetical protein